MNTAWLNLFHHRVGGDEHSAFRDSARGLIDTLVTPALSDWRAGTSTPAQALAGLGESGLLGTAAPEEFGGGGVPDVRFVVALVEELAAAGATALAHVVAVHSGIVIPLLTEHGGADHRQQWLPPLAAGTALAAVVAAGAVSGADEDGMMTATSVPGGGCAELFAVVRDDTIDLISARADGTTVSAVSNALGGLDCPQADLRIKAGGDRATIEAAGLSARMQTDADFWFAVVSLAASRRSLALAAAYTAERQVFGQRLADFENTRHRLAEIGAQLDVAQVYLDRALELRERGQLTPGISAVLRMTAALTHDRCADQSLQLHGGYGYMWEYPVSQAFSDAQYLRQQERMWSDPRDTIADQLAV